jgi:hypothetical protein
MTAFSTSNVRTSHSNSIRDILSISYLCKTYSKQNPQNRSILKSSIENVPEAEKSAQTVIEAKFDPTVHFACDSTRTEYLVPKAYYLRAVHLWYLLGLLNHLNS